MLSLRQFGLPLFLIGLAIHHHAIGLGRQSEEVSYNLHVRPILSDHCFPCHGPDEANRMAGLRLDVRQSAIDQGAIVPKNSTDSQLIDRICQADESLIMPPAKTRKKLSDAQIKILRAWIEQGATYQEHWAFVAPNKVPVPTNSHPIDFLLTQRWKALGIEPSPPASPQVLVRRLHFDLIGLPPDPVVVEEFCQDPSEANYLRIVDSLLANPHYGERMAIGWLDQVRFADTIGYHSDNPRNIWPYRDWVIRAWNHNLPYDHFTIQQIAGDLLPKATMDKRVASAFNRLVQSTEEGGAQPKDYESRMLADRVRAVGSVWLGLTTGCAQCHDHKFDPFTLRDFYALGAFFADIEEKPVGEREPGMLVIGDEARKQLADLDQAVEKAQATLRANAKEPTEAMMVEVERAKQARKAFYNSLPKCLVSQSMKTPRVVRVLPRGNWQDESGPEVQPAFPAFLAGNQSIDRLNRLDLAKWIVNGKNPLAARVQVNRVWRQLFGEGLCRTPNDFGLQGDTPTNQPLLDWLAVDFVEHGWDTKRLIRLIVSSQAYQRSSQVSSIQANLDPLNREFARQGRFRLDAELIRDQALAVSGLLERSIGGPSIKPYQPADYWENLNFPVRTYVAEPGKQQYKRGLYIWWQRTFLHPSLLAFDAPSREECSAERNRSNIPQQALVLLNDPCYLEAYRALASRVVKESPSTDTRARIDWCFRQVFQRQATASEIDRLQSLFESHLASYGDSTDAAKAWLSEDGKLTPSGDEVPELAAWSHVARVLMNLHEAITRY